MVKLFHSLVSFTKGEMAGMLLLCAIIFIILLAPVLFTRPEEKYDFTDFKKEIALFRAAEVKAESRYKAESNRTRSSQVRYFKFDPNLLDVVAWKRLGVKEYTARIIVNFVNKKGRFYRKEDLKKIYSLTDGDYFRLEPYIDIPDKHRLLAYTAPANTAVRESKPLIDLNEADSAALESINGVGPAFASRIIRYRRRLGGFYSVNQLREVYGIDSAKYAQIEKQVVVNSVLIKKLNINSAEFDELKKFPFLSYKQINAILRYRKQHGPFYSPDDLLATDVVSRAELAMLINYLEFL